MVAIFIVFLSLLFSHSSGNIAFTQIGLALLEAIDHSVTVHPFNSTFLKIQGDTFYGTNNCSQDVIGCHWHKIWIS